MTSAQTNSMLNGQPPTSRVEPVRSSRRRVGRDRNVGLPRRALSLLEVILAIAILGGAMIAIGELLRIGSRSSMSARELTTAQLHCESKLAEIAAGLLPAETAGPTPLEVDEDWRYSIEAAPTNQDGLLAVRVTVEQDLPPTSRPISFSLTRWIQDPNTVQTASSSTTSGSAAPTTSGS